MLLLNFESLHGLVHQLADNVVAILFHSVVFPFQRFYHGFQFFDASFSLIPTVFDLLKFRNYKKIYVLKIVRYYYKTIFYDVTLLNRKIPYFLQKANYRKLRPINFSHFAACGSKMLYEALYTNLNT